MRPIPSLLFAASFLLFSMDVAGQTGSWSPKANFSGGNRQDGVAFAIGRRVFMGLGRNPANNQLQQDLWEYNPITNVWTQRANFGGGQRQLAIAIGAGNFGYVGLGQGPGITGPMQDLWRYDPATNTWTQRANLPGSRRMGAMVFTNGFDKVHVVAGLGLNSAILNDHWRYNISANTWTQRASIPGARYGGVAFADFGGGFVGLGMGTGNQARKDLYRYSDILNSWTQRASHPLGAVGFVYPAHFSLSKNDRGYIAGGYFQTIVNNQAVLVRSAGVWSYHRFDNTWLQEPNLPTVRSECMAVGLHDRAFLTTGADGANSFTSNTQQFLLTPTEELYNAKGAFWTRKADFPGGLFDDRRSNNASFTLNNRGYMGTGSADGTLVRDFWEYNPVTNAWSQKANFGGPERFSAVGFAIGNLGYIGCGSALVGQFSSQPVNDFWQYDPATNTWTQRANVGGSGRVAAMATAIAGKGYICGGQNSGTALNDLWEYTPATNTWTQRANFPGGVRYGGVAFTINNLGYFGMGRANFNTPSANDLWAYNPATNTWTARASLPGQGRDRVWSFVSAQKGYVGGGVLNSSQIVSQLWEYDPVANSWTKREDLPTNGRGRADASTFALGSEGYVSCGFDGLGTPQTWAYNPICPGTNNIRLQVTTDVFGSDTRWEIRPAGSTEAICGGNYLPNSTLQFFDCCLTNGCYDLIVFDNFGDGIANNGGYVLRDGAGQRIIDNSQGGLGFTFQSQVTNTDGTPWSFCLPIGNDALVNASCDQTFSLNNVVTIQVQENPTVTAQLGVGNQANHGYQICIFDPNGGFRRNVYQSFASPGTAFPAGTPTAQRPTYFNLNFGNAPFLPTGRHLNIRVRSKVNNVFTQCGPACRIRFTAPVCSGSQLTTTADPVVSCGATGVNVNTGVLYATLVPGANRYQFQFTGPNGYARNILAPASGVNALATRTLNMSTMTTGKPPCNTAITVQVRASFDGGTTFCNAGSACTVTFTGCSGRAPEALEAADERPLRVWPNPVVDGRLYIDAGDSTGEGATLELFNSAGQRVRTQGIAGVQGILTLEVGGLPAGVYVLHISTADRRHIERVVLQ